MDNKFIKNPVKDNYSILYFEVMKGLEIGFEEYIVLQIMLKFSKRNEIKLDKSLISKTLCISRNTLDKVLVKLISKGHINKVEAQGKAYYISVDVKEKFEIAGLYVKIYHKHRKLLKLSLKQYAFLYMIYSLSKKYDSKIAIAGKEKYCDFLNISKSHYDTTKGKFKEANLIEPQKNHFLKLNIDVFNWFESRNVQS
ncbi:hypothetical protein DI487_12785 [Flavobacterium sediminis]|uniref:Uncharacterized protein n=1 Tax=Flavobacterium sediminis TaxID=2201181 RepID=A0A2U8QWY3_9FLAO|nr:hypothetical protein [Flavobacterium sediminis]AWM14643.1 hypothetical protein DI487_12785 [Flavobacterium sediminis]